MNAEYTLEVADEAGTAAFAAMLAAALAAGDRVAVEGELGAGKTFLVRHLAYALGLPRDEPVTSPTFALVQELPTSPVLFHADLFRIDEPAALEGLGLEAFEQAPGTIVVAEWAERFSAALGGFSAVVEIEVGAGDARRLRVRPRSARGRALVRTLQAAHD